jgi:hypothetical protein
MNILIKNCPSLIGDFLGIAPALQKLAKNNNVYVDTSYEIDSLLELVSSRHNIFKQKNIVYDKKIDINITEPFTMAHHSNLYMTQAFCRYLGVEYSGIPKADLDYSSGGFQYEDFYVISPFARSLPPDQKLSMNVWQEVINHSGKHFIVLGNSKHDMNTLNRTLTLFDKPFDHVCQVLRNCKGLISLVTGTSHLAFHLGVKNILLTNQGTTGWGVNPDAVKITKHIPTITAEDIIKHLN